MAISVSADMRGMEAYIGTVGGILQAVEDPRFKGDFTEHLMDATSDAFWVDTIAAKQSGLKSILHVFEWGDNNSVMSDIPLFKLIRSGGNSSKTLSYVFLPSTKFVPLPEGYGIKQEKLESLRRHVFQMKALVMETKRKTIISPKAGDKLFIPKAGIPGGYYMTKKSSVVNPGGPQATGGFATWWNDWFATRAQAVVDLKVESTENWLVATGAKYVRYAAGTVINGTKVGGRFAAGRNVNFGHVNSKEREVKRKVMADSRSFFNKEQYDSQWD